MTDVLPVFTEYEQQVLREIHFTPFAHISFNVPWIRLAALSASFFNQAAIRESERFVA